MFDVSTAMQIYYDETNDLAVTIFRDRTDPNTWYMVPVPRLRVQAGQPVFALTKYLTNQNGIAGSCAFEVELHFPQEARKAAEIAIGKPVVWGQFTWVSGEAAFDFESSETGVVHSRSVSVSPSLFGSNVANFYIPLPTEADLNNFVAAFSGEGSISGFTIRYEMGALTQLLAASAVVSYNAAAAVEYERKYESQKNIWGQTHDVLKEVRQVLKQSGAGDVKLTPGPGATDLVKQLVRDWAWSTLEKQVAQAIDAALALSNASGNPVSATNDFTASYSEDAIIEWSTPVSAMLPKFDSNTWKNVYKEVDNRQLVVTFALTGNYYSADNVALFERVKITVDYPTRETDNSFELVPGQDGKMAHTYVAPGQGKFEEQYQYRYEVEFSDAPPYTSDWITSTDTLIYLRPNAFGVRNVEFVGSNVPFTGNGAYLVETVFIDYFDNPPAGQPAKLQTKELKGNGPDSAVAFTSTYRVPLTNTYAYRLRYVLKTGQVVTTQQPPEFGSNNADKVMVLTPAPSITTFDLTALVTNSGTGFMDIGVNAAYFDDQNSSTTPPLNHDWSGWTPPLSPPGAYRAETWRFSAHPDPQTAYFRVNGQILYGDGEIFTLDNINVAFGQRPLILSDLQQIYSVKIITERIDWNIVSQVVVNMFQLFDTSRLPESGPPLFFLQPVAELPGDARNLVQGSRTQTVAFAIFSPTQTKKSLPLYYTLRKPRALNELSFYFNADYVFLDGSRKSIANTKIEDKLQLILPPVGDSDTQVIQRIVIPASRL